MYIHQHDNDLHHFFYFLFFIEIGEKFSYLLASRQSPHPLPQSPQNIQTGYLRYQHAILRQKAVVIDLHSLPKPI